MLAKNQGEVAHVLANFYLNKAYLDKRFSSQPEQATLWYQQVIRLNYPKATIALADLYFHQGKVLEAQNLLAKLNVIALSRTQHDDIAVAAIILTTKIAISLGDIELVNALLIKFMAVLQGERLAKCTYPKQNINPRIAPT